MADFTEERNRKLILEDGTVFTGFGFGASSEKVVELVFNTSMVGYQEILSDPSYTYQAVVMTYPLIGNYGMAAHDYETQNPSMSGLIVREYCDKPSNFRCENTLSEIMIRYDIAGIYGIDTRRLARHIRNFGSTKALITDASEDTQTALERLRNSEIPKDAVSRVSTAKRYTAGKIVNKSDDGFHVVAIDCGMKKNIVRKLGEKGCMVTVVPWNTSAGEILELAPDGVFISNGPGDPADVTDTIETIKKLIGKKPIFGICLGHQIISRAYGADTYKLKFGHRGGNHPVKNIITDKIEITSQNHSFAVDTESLKNTGLTVSHINLLDNTVEGVRCEKDYVFSVQYHPESAPGPQDSTYLFDEFISQMKKWKEDRKNA